MLLFKKIAFIFFALGILNGCGVHEFVYVRNLTEDTVRLYLPPNISCFARYNNGIDTVDVLTYSRLSNNLFCTNLNQKRTIAILPHSTTAMKKYLKPFVSREAQIPKEFEYLNDSIIFHLNFKKKPYLIWYDILRE